MKKRKTCKGCKYWSEATRSWRFAQVDSYAVSWVCEKHKSHVVGFSVEDVISLGMKPFIKNGKACNED